MPVTLRLSDDDATTVLEMFVLALEVAALNVRPSLEAPLQRYEAVASAFLSQLGMTSLSAYLERDRESNKPIISERFLEQTQLDQTLQEARDTLFWEELTIRLAERDAMAAMGEAPWDKLPEEEKDRRSKPLERKYWELFTSQGLAPLLWVHAPENSSSPPRP